MAYNIAVCVKPVPDPDCYDRVTIDPRTKTITREGIPTIINPVDKSALEVAMRLCEKREGVVSVVSMAPPGAVDTLRETLAMGADAAYLLSDRAFGGADTLATSYTLYRGLKKIEAAAGRPFDLVLCGCESADGATAQVSSQLGEWIETPHLWNVCALEDEEEGVFSIKTKVENGFTEWRGRAPLVLGVAREIAKPRFTTVKGILKAKSKPLTVWGRADIEADDAYLGLKGSPTQAGAIFSPDMKRAGTFLKGTPSEIAGQILAALRGHGVGAGGQSS